MVEYTKSALREMASEEARRAGVDPDLFIRLIQQESQFKPQATSRVGAKGLGQVMPDTARQPGYGVQPFASENLMDPQENLRFSADYLGAMLREFDGDVPKALAAYNAGAGAVQEYGGVPPFKETQQYVDIIAGDYQGSGYTPSDSDQRTEAARRRQYGVGGVDPGSSAEILQAYQEGMINDDELRDFLAEDEESFLDKLGGAAGALKTAGLMDAPEQRRVRSLPTDINRGEQNVGSRALQRMGIASLA